MNFTPIPIVDLKAQYASIKYEIQNAIDRVLESQQFILGEEVQTLETLLAKYCQCKYAFGVSSGTDALLISLMSIGIKPGDEVVTTPYSFFATVGSIARLGAVPVFVDIDPASFNIQPEKIEKVITSRTKAIIPVHIAGQSADMDPILELGKRYGLYIIEDACQAIGSDYKGKRTGSMGHLGCFSFFPSKNLGGYGDSGLVTTNDGELADKVMLLRNHGQRPKYHNHLIGGNFRMDALQAAVLVVKFKYIEQWIEARRDHAEKYREIFNKSGILLSLDELDFKKGIFLPRETGFGRNSHHLFMIRTKYRDGLASYLKNNHIGCEIHYPIPLHLQDCFRYLGYQKGDFPQSENASNEVLSLPIYPEMTDDMLSRVAGVILEFINLSDI
jgi:dTDP-4-amino-4,6-dideoxygalactose transaminase